MGLSFRLFFGIMFCVLTTATGGAGSSFWAVAGASSLGGAATMGTNSIIEQTGDGVGLDDVSWGRVAESSLIGAVSGFASGGVGHWAANSSALVNGFNSPLLRSIAVSPLAAGAGHITGGTTSGLIQGRSINQAFHDSFNGLDKSMAMGLGIGVASTIGVSYASGINPINGRAFATKGVKNFVYTSRNANGEVDYAGITNDLARRAAEHLSSKGIRIQKLMSGLSRSDARAVEQALIDIHGLGKNGGTLLNKINSISPKNPIYNQQLQRGYDLLKSIGY